VVNGLGYRPRRYGQGPIKSLRQIGTSGIARSRDGLI
jgi:hypothetical protein